MRSVIDVVPCEVLKIFIGDTTCGNGGGCSPERYGHGGGATDIRRGAGLFGRLVIAGGGGGAASPPAGYRLVELRKYYENETSKGKPYIKAFAKVDGTDMDVYVWDAHNHQIVKDNCPGMLHATGEYEEFRGKTRFKLGNAELVEQAPPPKKESFDDSDIPF